ncbi:MAG: MATE family efflux transporter [Coprococcus sp.]
MQNIRKCRVLDMTEGSPFQLLLKFSLPLFLGNLLQQLYNLADTSIAGNLLGDGALAQLGATAALYGLITNFAFGLNNGLALTVSRHFGAGNQKEMKKSVCWMVSLSVISSIVLTAFFLMFRDSFLKMLQIPEETAAGAMSYLTVILAGIPLTMVYNLEAALLQAVGNSFTPLIFLFCSSVLNVGLDFLFMGPLGLGVQGAAIATVMAQGISAVLGFFYIFKNYPELRFGKQEYCVKPRFVLEMLWTGMSMALMSTIYNIGSVVLQSSINALGSTYIAAQVGGRRLAELFYIPGIALGTGVATYASQNCGANRRYRITKGVKAAMLMYGAWWVVAVLFTFTLAPAVVKLITGSDSTEVIYNAVLYLKISIPMIPPMAVLVILRNALQGMQHSVAPLFCSALELIGKIVFALWIVPSVGYIAVCICEPVTWVVCCMFILGATFMCRNEFNGERQMIFSN